MPRLESHAAPLLPFVRNNLLSVLADPKHSSILGYLLVPCEPKSAWHLIKNENGQIGCVVYWSGTKVVFDFVAETTEKWAKEIEWTFKWILGQVGTVRFYALPSTIYATLQSLCKYDHYQKSYNMLYLPASKSRSLSLDSKIELPKGYYRGVLTADNVDEVLSTATLSYDASYIRQLITSPPYRHLQSAIFYTPNSSDTVSDNAESTETQSKVVPIAWALSHVDLSLGLVYTNPSHRRLGFARDCIVSVISKQLDYFRNVAEQFHSEDLNAQKEWDQLKETQQSSRGRCKQENGLEDRGMFCFVDVHNEKSRQLMKSIGFEVIEGMEYFWGYTTDGLVTKSSNGDNGNQNGLNGGLVG